MAEVAFIGADIQEVIGSVIALNILNGDSELAVDIGGLMIASSVFAGVESLPERPNVTDESEVVVLPSQFNSLADDSTQTDSDTGMHQSHKVEGIPLKVVVHAIQRSVCPKLRKVNLVISRA